MFFDRTKCKKDELALEEEAEQEFLAAESRIRVAGIRSQLEAAAVNLRQENDSADHNRRYREALAVAVRETPPGAASPELVANRVATKEWLEEQSATLQRNLANGKATFFPAALLGVSKLAQFITAGLVKFFRIDSMGRLWLEYVRPETRKPE